MWTNQRHVTDKLDLLDPESQWRKDMRTVVDKFTELLPHIKHLLCGSGDWDDQKELPKKFPRFSATLEEVILQLQTSLAELHQRKTEWESALKLRNGDMAVLDRKVHESLEKIFESTKELESIQHKTEQERQALEPLQLQVKQAEAELHQAQEKICGFQDQERSLQQREEELTERSQKFEDHRRAKGKDFEDRKSNMEQAQAEHKEVLHQLQSREIVVGKTEEEQARAKISLERASLDMKSAHSVLKSLANVTETGLEPSLASTEALACAIRERYSNLQEASDMKQQTLDQALQRNSRLEEELDSTMKTLRETNRVHTVQMNGYDGNKHRVFSLESKVSQLEKLEPRVNDLQLECAQLRDDNGALDQYRKGLEQDLAECRENKARQEQELKKQLNDMAKENTKLTQSTTTQAKQLQVLKKRLDDMTKANTDLNRSLADRDARIGTYETHIQYLDGKIQQLQAQLTTDQENAQVLRLGLQTSRSEVEACKKDYHTIVEDRDRIAQDNGILNANLAETLEANTKLAKSKDSLKSERNSLKTQLTDAQQSCNAKEGRLQENSRELKNLQSSLEASHNENASMNAEVESLRHQRETLQSEAQRHSVQLQNNLDLQKRIVANKDDEIKRLENDLRSKNTTCQRLSKESDRLKELFGEVGGIRAGHSGTGSDLPELEQAFEDFASSKDQEVHDLKQQLQTGQEANRTLQHTVERLEGEKNKEVSDINMRLAELREAYQGQANKYTVMEKELSAKNNAIETLQRQLTQAQAGSGILLRPHSGDHTPNLGNRHGTGAQQDQPTPGVRNAADGTTLDLNLRARQQISGARNPADNTAPDLNIRASQQISGVRNAANDTAPDLHLRACQQILGSLKRKAGDMGPDSNTERQNSGTRSRRGDGTAPGLSSGQQNPIASNLSTWAIANLRDPTYVPDPPLPAETLSTVRESLHEWDRRKADWAKPRIGRRCVESIVSKKASTWPHGEAVECEYCKKHKKQCIVVEKAGHLTLLPQYQGG